jgi:hypothetical protein
MQSKANTPRRNPSRCFARTLAPPLLFLSIVSALNAQTDPAPDARLIRAHDLCASGETKGGRAEYAQLAADTNAPAALRSIAQLSLAQTWCRKKDWSAAANEFAKVLALPGVPAHHREEAQAQVRELKRLQAGQSARGPSPMRTSLPPRPAPGIELHVSPRGSDTNPGTPARPFATLERARDEIRQLRQRSDLPPGGVAVVVHGGRYPVVRPFALGTEDSGSVRSPVIYRAAAGETPVFSGGARVTGFEPVRDAAILRRLPAESRGKVFQADLKAQGISNVPPVRMGGFASGAGFSSHPALELFFNGEAMPLSRWPNDGFVQVVEVRGTTAQTGPGPTGAKDGVITYDGDRPRRWTDDRDLLLYGYWFYGWADSYERVEKIDLEKKEITLAPPFHTYGYRRGQPFKAMNLLSEIDQPGEWYLDRRRLTLYFYPPSDLTRAQVEISLTETPLVELKNVSHVSFEGPTRMALS